MKREVQDAFHRYLLSLADDELVAGYRATEWTGIAPTLEEDVAFSSIGQDEVGHARAYYALLHELTGTMVDYRARQPDEYLHAQLVELACAPRYHADGNHAAGGDWAFALVRQYLYDLFDAERLQALRGSAWEPLAQQVEKMQREEKYHLHHGQLWFDRLALPDEGLAEDKGESRGRLRRALERAWPDALGLFEPVANEALLVRERLVPATAQDLLQRWLDRLHPLSERYRLPFPAERVDGSWNVTVEPRRGGRQGRHTADWTQLWDDMTSVYRLDPTATW